MALFDCMHLHYCPYDLDIARGRGGGVGLENNLADKCKLAGMLARCARRMCPGTKTHTNWVRQLDALSV